MNKKDAWCFKIEFHKKLAEIMQKEYGIVPVFTNLISWGYTTTAYYVKTENEEYVARVTKYQEDKLSTFETDILMTKYLKGSVPVSDYIKSNKGEYVIFVKEEKNDDDLILVKDSMIRVTKYIQGTPPFDMDFEIYKQMLKYLEIIHNTKPPKFYLPVVKNGNGNNSKVLLHGDLTPSNVLIAYGKISAILDFEEAKLGPVEYDIANTLIFSWFRMKSISYQDMWDKTCEHYQSKLNSSLISKYSNRHIEKHLKNIKKHKKLYENEIDWKNDHDFTREKLNQISKLKSCVK